MSQDFASIFLLDIILPYWLNFQFAKFLKEMIQLNLHV